MTTINTCSPVPATQLDNHTWRGLLFMRVFGIMIAAITLWSYAASAESAPETLRGKSVTASWTEERVQRFGDEQEFAPRNFAMQLIVYISSEGRLFAKRTVSNNRARRGRTGSAASVGEGSGRGQAAQLRGRTVTVFSRFSDGARMMKIDFDQSFSSCEATVVMGSEKAGGTIKGKSRIHRGTTIEIQSTKVSGMSCSIRSGNAFGQ